MEYLESSYAINQNYILIGHSAGGTMALELQSPSLPVPAVVLGIAGIYDFEGLLKAHDHPAYQEFMENAFPDKSTWMKAAPFTNYSPDNLYEKAKLVAISSSGDDELVEPGQAISMLERIASGPLPKGNVHFLKATGTHDEIWGSGSILAGLVKDVVELLDVTM